MDCPHCGKPVLDDHVMNAKAKILASLSAGQPLHAGEIAQIVYGQDSPRNRNRVIVHIWHMNRPRKRIQSDGRGPGAKGYSVAKRSAA
jgi:hypothetical protein